MVGQVLEPVVWALIGHGRHHGKREPTGRRRRLELILERWADVCGAAGWSTLRWLWQPPSTSFHASRVDRRGSKTRLRPAGAATAPRYRNLVDWADECTGNGWSVDRDRLVRALEALQVRIAEQGGQRKARPYIQSQLRRLRRQTC